tara:strand:+ start:1138 stop:1386 length:249 start_codon:yes stop_codon:yes gene_type:complete
MNLKKGDTIRGFPSKGTTPEESKEVIKQAAPKASSLKEAYPTIEELKNALRKGTDAEKNQIASLANAKTSNSDEILNIWRNS